MEACFDWDDARIGRIRSVDPAGAYANWFIVGWILLCCDFWRWLDHGNAVDVGIDWLAVCTDVTKAESCTPGTTNRGRSSQHLFRCLVRVQSRPYRRFVLTRTSAYGFAGGCEAGLSPYLLEQLPAKRSLASLGRRSRSDSSRPLLVNFRSSRRITVPRQTLHESPFGWSLFTPEDSLKSMVDEARTNNILVVDDSPTMRRMVITSLGALRTCKPTQAGSGLEAIERVAI